MRHLPNPINLDWEYQPSPNILDLVSWPDPRTLKKSVFHKVVNTVSAGVLFFQLERNVSVSERFGVPFRGCTVHLYIYIQDKLIINYALQSTNTMSSKHNFKI
jgi:hypothetical protein